MLLTELTLSISLATWSLNSIVAGESVTVVSKRLGLSEANDRLSINDHQPVIDHCFRCLPESYVLVLTNVPSDASGRYITIATPPNITKLDETSRKTSQSIRLDPTEEL